MKDGAAKEAAAVDDLRLDKWLWAARFYKTRQLAIDAINAGHVTVNAQRAKPARSLREGDEIVVRKPPFVQTVIVKALSAKRTAASIAQGLYQETDASRKAREALVVEMKAMPPPLFKGRPTKRDRRLLDKLHSEE
jgi:ribosome-associated heat shock protein Hsp15